MFPAVSVCVICYNQASYIRQALDSVIHQKLTHSLEIIIADDFSTDGTREIVMEYAGKYPLLINVLERKKNIGPANNFIELISAANGRYVAYLEGDDYWSAETKLQQQVDFLEEHPDFAICFTDALETFSENVDDERNYLRNGSSLKSETTINDLIFRNYIQSCTVVFRNKLFGQFPAWYSQLKMGDWPFHLMNAVHGKIKYFSFPTAVHRNHSSGVWSTQHVLGRISNTIKAYEVLRADADFNKLQNFKKSRSNVYLLSVKYYIKEMQFGHAVLNFIKGLFIYPAHLFGIKKPV